MERTFLIGVAGGSASGKSTVTEYITKALGVDNVAVIVLDNYYVSLAELTFEERLKINFDHPDAFDWDLLYSDLVKLCDGNAINMPIYDYINYTRKADSTIVNPVKILVFEGLFALLDPRIRELMSLQIYVDTADDIRFIRRLQRDIAERGRTTESVITQYLQYVRPMHRQFIEPTKRYANIIIPHGANKAALEMIEARLKAQLNNEILCSSYSEEGMVQKQGFLLNTRRDK